jgi:putative glutamine amidotransferase
MMTNMQMPKTPVPLVGVSACVKDIGGNDFHAVFRTYVDAVVNGAEAQPLIIPALGDSNCLYTLLNSLDGILLTGSPSNVEPHHYGGPESREGVLHDAHRDATTLPLIRAAIDAGVPLLAICRGFQELNVVYGGTLHQHLQEVEGRTDHRMERHLPLEERYRPRHPVTVTPGGKLHALVGKDEIMVNSLHGQGIDRVGDGLTVEAVAHDGTIEAFSVDDAPGFALAVQWHAEFAVRDNPESLAIFHAFRDALRRRATERMERLGRNPEHVA